MDNLRELVRELERGSHREENIPVYCRELAETYVNYAATELALSAFLLYDWVRDLLDPFSEIQEIYDGVLALLKYISEDDTQRREEIVEQAEQLRTRVTVAMDAFTSYVDRLSCYDRVLNIMEIRVKPNPELVAMLDKINEEKFQDYIVKFLHSDRDRTVLFERLRLLVEFIPIHMTKNKLLDRISDTLSLYEGGDRESLDGFLYMIRSAGMLHRPEENSDAGEAVREYLEELENTDFSKVDSEAYEELRESMSYVTNRVSCVTDFYCMAQKVINAVYALCLAREHAPDKSPDDAICMEIVREVAREDCWAPELEKVEGKIEKYVEKMNVLEAILPEVRQSGEDVIREQGRQMEFEHYDIISRLLSDSLFVRLRPEEEGGVVDRAMIRRVTEEVTAEFSEYLGSLPKAVRRSAMSAVLRELPIPFENTKEIRDYIHTNLFGCQDVSERTRAFADIFEMIQEQTPGLEWRGGNDLLV